MQLEAGELGEPDQRRAVVGDDEVEHPDRAHLDRLGADPVRGVLGSPLLEEALPLDSVGKPDPGQRAAGEVGQDRVGDPGVVVDRLALGERGLRAAAPAAARRPEDLVEVRERDLAPVDLYLPAFALLRDRLLEVERDLALFELGLEAGSALFASSPLTAASDLLERRHQVGRLRRRGRLGGGRDHLLALRLALDQRQDLVAVLVAVLGGVEVGGERVDQRLGHLELLLGRLAVRGVELVRDLVRRDDLVGEAHRRHRHHPVHRPQRGEVLLAAQHEARDRDLAGVLHRLDEQRVGLLGALVGAEVVGVIEVDRVDLVQVDEVLDLDRPRLLRVELLELVTGDDHVLLGGDLVPLDDVLVGHLLAVGLRDALVADPRAVGLAQLAEAHRLLRDGGVELHGHVEEPEGD